MVRLRDAMTGPIIQPIRPGAGTDRLTGWAPFGAFYRVVCHDWTANLTAISASKTLSFADASGQIAQRCCGDPWDRCTWLHSSPGPNSEHGQAPQAVCPDPRQPSRARCPISMIACFWAISADCDALGCAGTPRVPAPARTRPGPETYGGGTCWGRCPPTPDRWRQL
jgi:hypothetical protein